MAQINISKDNGVGVVLNTVPYNKIINIATPLTTQICSDVSDPITTYVSMSIWSYTINNYLYPPYVECEYVD